MQSKANEGKSGGYEIGLGSSELSATEKIVEATVNFLSRYALVVVAVWICAVAISMAGYSRQKPLWADELLFRWIATLPTIKDIWRALTLGINPDPPLAHVLTHGLTILVGSGPLIVRLTALCGECAMLLFLFLALRRYVGPLYALLGLVLPFCTTLVTYGYEARPYGLMYGCLAAAIFFWVKVGDDHSNDDRSNSIGWNVALALALTAFLACHFYSVFALPAFYLGEFVRIRRRNSVSWQTLFALAGASASVLLYLPIIIAGHKYSSAYFGKPYLLSVPGMITSTLSQLGVPLFAFLFLAAIFFLRGIRFTQGTSEDESVHSPELAALALGFLLIPFLAWGAGVLVLKAFVDRYVLHGLFGVFLLLPLFASRIFGRNRPFALALLVSCGLPGLLFISLGAARVLRAPSDIVAAASGGARPLDLTLLESALPKLDGDIVVSNPQVFMQMVSDSPILKARCIYLWDRENELRLTGQDGFTHWAIDGMKMGWFRAEPWADYSDKNKAFLFLTAPDGGSDGLGWLRDYVESENRYGEVVMKVGQYVVVAAKPSQAGIAH